MSDLNPCPFCGGPAKDNPFLNGPEEYHSIECANPNCFVIVCTCMFDSYVEAADAWNTRAERTCGWVKHEWHFITGCGWDVDRLDAPTYCQQCGGKIVVKGSTP